MSADTPDVLTAGEAYYRERGWSGCAGSAWDRLSPATQDGWNAAAAERERADAAEAKIAAVKALAASVPHFVSVADLRAALDREATP